MMTGIMPILSPIAAVGLAIIMVGAVHDHVHRRKNPLKAIPVPALLVVSAVLGFQAVLAG